MQSYLRGIQVGSAVAAARALLGDVFSSAIIQEHSSIIIVRGFWHSLRDHFKLARRRTLKSCSGLSKSNRRAR